jgi:hypothetical protein
MLSPPKIKIKLVLEQQTAKKPCEVMDECVIHLNVVTASGHLYMEAKHTPLKHT